MMRSMARKTDWLAKRTIKTAFAQSFNFLIHYSILEWSWNLQSHWHSCEYGLRVCGSNWPEEPCLTKVSITKQRIAVKSFVQNRCMLSDSQIRH